MELEVVARIVQRWWLAIIAGLLIGGVLGYAYGNSRTPVYQAGVDMLVGPLSADTNVLRAAGQTAQTYAELASASSTLAEVGRDLGDNRARRVTVTATASEVTRILKIRVRHESPVFVADVANGIAAELIEVAENEIGTGEEAVGNAGRVGEVRVLEAASIPSEPVSPNKQLMTALGGLAMMVAVAAAVVAYEYMRQAVRVLGDVAAILPDKVFGRVERSWDAHTEQPGQITVLRHEHGPTAVSLRGISIDIASQIPPDSPNSALAMSGVDARDRSADVAINVAAALASTGRRVAVIDADEDNRAVRTWLAPRCDQPAEPFAIRIDSGSSIDIIGRFTEIESGVLDLYDADMRRLPDRANLEAALDDLGAGYDHVVVHSAPVFGSPAAVRWASAAAGSILVVTADAASARTVERCALTLSRSARLFLGAVFDERPRSTRRRSALRLLFGGGRAPQAESAARRPAQTPSGHPPTPEARPVQRPPDREAAPVARQRS